MLILAGRSIVLVAIIAPLFASVKIPGRGSGSVDFTDSAAIAKALASAPVNKKNAAQLVDPQPAVPSSYDLVFGPTNGANGAPGYMGFVLLSTYDAHACADLCNSAAADANGGQCKYFNIWQSTVDGNLSSAVCAKYYLPTNATTATNLGDAHTGVSLSRGYRRTSLLPDGTFDGYQCKLPQPNGSSSCYTEEFGGWIGTSPTGGFLDATIANYPWPAHSGNSIAQLGGQATNIFPGTLSPESPLATEVGVLYSLEFFHQSQHAPQPSFPDTTPTFDIIWNELAIGTITGFYPTWTLQQFTVLAAGNDTLAFHGGAFPNVVNLDDIYLFVK